jgi:hypothetical protein
MQTGEELADQVLHVSVAAFALWLTRPRLALFAVERAHECCWIARTRHRAARRDGLDLRQLLGRERLRRERLVELLHRAHTERGTNSGAFASTQPIASWLGVMPQRFVSPWSPATSFVFASPLSPLNRGMRARASPAPTALAESSPRESTP